MMRVVVLGTVAAAGLALATAAQAMPLTPAPLGLAGGDTPIEKVYDGCGWGRHLNGWGQCVLNPALRYGPPQPVYGGYGGGYGYYGGSRPYGYVPPRPYGRPFGYAPPRPYYY